VPLIERAPPTIKARIALGRRRLHTIVMFFGSSPARRGMANNLLRMILRVSRKLMTVLPKEVPAQRTARDIRAAVIKTLLFFI
jgi:hypothetical protein